MNIQYCDTFWAKIYIAGPITQIEQTCREFCLDGFCVTVTPTKYIYTMGEESGAEIGLINYPRFPSTPEDIMKQAALLGDMLMKKCHQGSFTLMSPTATTFVSRRKQDEMTRKR